WAGGLPAPAGPVDTDPDFAASAARNGLRPDAAGLPGLSGRNRRRPRSRGRPRGAALGVWLPRPAGPPPDHRRDGTTPAARRTARPPYRHERGPAGTGLRRPAGRLGRTTDAGADWPAPPTPGHGPA